MASIIYDRSDIGEYEAYGGKKCLHFNQRPKPGKNMQFGSCWYLNDQKEGKNSDACKVLKLDICCITNIKSILM